MPSHNRKAEKKSWTPFYCLCFRPNRRVLPRGVACVCVCVRSQRAKAGAVFAWQCAFHMKNKRQTNKKKETNPPLLHQALHKSGLATRRRFCFRHTIFSPSRPSRGSAEDNKGRQNWKLKSDCRFPLHIPHKLIRLREHNGRSAFLFPIFFLVDNTWILHSDPWLFSSQIFFWKIAPTARMKEILSTTRLRAVWYGTVTFHAFTMRRL